MVNPSGHTQSILRLIDEPFPIETRDDIHEKVIFLTYGENIHEKTRIFLGQE